MSLEKYNDLMVNLTSVHTIINKRIDATLSSIHGISYTEYVILHKLYHYTDACSSRINLAHEIGLSASGITRCLAPLQKIGLIEKGKNSRDSRMSLVKLTQAGRKIFEESSITVNEKVSDVFYDLKDDILENAIAVLTSLQKRNVRL